MLEQLLQLQFVLPVCVGLSLTGILALVFTFQNGGNFFSIWRKKGYSQVNTDPDDHRHHQTYLDRTLATLGSAASATLRLVRTSCSNLAAIYSDSVISSLYPARLFIQNGESVPESQVESAQFNWLSPKAWYLATSRWLSSTWKLVRGSGKPEIFCQPGGFADLLQQQCPSLHQPYAPPFWARNRHVHLISSVTLRKPFINPHYQRQLVFAEDGGSFSLDWFNGCDSNPSFRDNAPLLLVVHALTGDSQDSYVKWMCNAAHSLHWRAVAFNYRGCGDTKLTSPVPFHQPQDTKDIYVAIKTLRKRFPEAPVFAAGFSLGAYTLNKYVGEADSGVFASDGRLDGCTCLGSGYDFNAEMAKCSKPMTFSAQYCSAILAYWKGYLKQHAEQLSKHAKIDFTAAKRARTMQDFDRAVICPVFGYDSVEECYDASNGLRWIDKIRTPTMLVSAQDDPFLEKTVMPIRECAASRHVMFVLTKFGSHCGHMQGWWPLGQSWLDIIVMEFFKAVLMHNRQAAPSMLMKDIAKDVAEQHEQAVRENSRLDAGQMSE